MSTLNKLDFPIVRRCVCGHVLEWHWNLGATGGVVLSSQGNRCPAYGSCDCTMGTWDGQEPRQIQPLRPEDCSHAYLGGTA